MNNNQRRNSSEINQFRKELKAMMGDITEIDTKVLNRAVNEGVGVAKMLTPTETGFMKKSWRSTPTIKRVGGVVEKSIANSADYSEYVNYGHRIVTKSGRTVGWVKGRFMLEKAVSHTERGINREFQKEIERIRREHGV